MNNTSIEWTDTTCPPVYEHYGPSYYGRQNVRLAEPVSKTGAREGGRVVNFSGRLLGILRRYEVMHDPSGLSWAGWWVDWDAGFSTWLNGDSMQLVGLPVEATLGKDETVNQMG